jgi:hypothetical protein
MRRVVRRELSPRAAQSLDREQAQADTKRDAGALNVEADDHGLLGWCFDGLGCLVSPFSDLQARHPDVWEACLQGYRQP